MVSKLSETEDKLLEACKLMQYGELRDVLVPAQEPDRQPDAPLSKRELALLNLIRSGVQEIETLTVHQGEPASAVVLREINGFRAYQKIKLD